MPFGSRYRHRRSARGIKIERWTRRRRRVNPHTILRLPNELFKVIDLLGLSRPYWNSRLR